MRVDLRGMCCLILFSVVLISSESLALDINNFLEERHDRFYQPDPGEPAKTFIGDPGVLWQTGLDLSGVARVYDPTIPRYRTWVTMISETHYMAVAHARRTYNAPIREDTLTFYRENDLNGDFWTLSPDLDSNGESTENIAQEVFVDGDFYIGKLKEAPEPWVKRYPLLKRPDIDSLGFNYWANSENNRQIAVVGKGDGDDNPHSSHLNIVRVGLRQINRHTSSQDIIHGELPDNNPLYSDTTILPGGDSGAPSFVVNDTYGAALVGNHTNGITDISISAHLDDLIQKVEVDAQEAVTVVTDLAGDFNADFRVDGLDLNTLTNNFGSSGSYSQGDANLDGVINGLDLNILTNNFGLNLLDPGAADVNSDGAVNHWDFAMIALNWGGTGPSDADGDGTVGLSDVQIFDDYWIVPDSLARVVPYSMQGDFDADGIVSISDYTIAVNNFGQTVNAFEDGDADGNGVVNPLDLIELTEVLGGNVIADANDDGVIDISDVAFITDQSRWLSSVPSGIDNRTYGDINNDGTVNNSDLSLLATWWRYGYSFDDRGQSSLQSPTVPEPSSLVMLTLAFGFCSLSNRRNYN